jgi:hypothetical protein
MLVPVPRDKIHVRVIKSRIVNVDIFSGTAEIRVEGDICWHENIVSNKRIGECLMPSKWTANIFKNFLIDCLKETMFNSIVLSMHAYAWMKLYTVFPLAAATRTVGPSIFFYGLLPHGCGKNAEPVLGGGFRPAPGPIENNGWQRVKFW